MLTINIHEAKTHLSRLIDRVVNEREPFVIAKSGKPMVIVNALDTPKSENVKRLGFMVGWMTVPNDFDRMGVAEIEELFGGEE